MDEADQHNYTGIRVPLTDGQEEFDTLVLALVKVLIDSLNEKKLSEGLKNLKDNAKGIDKLECWIEEHSVKDKDNHIKFIRQLQELRSSGAGHRKGRGYRKIKEEMGINISNNIRKFEIILEQSDKLLVRLGEQLDNNPFNNEEPNYD